jgi:hypothetical protein
MIWKGRYLLVGYFGVEGNLEVRMEAWREIELRAQELKLDCLIGLLSQARSLLREMVEQRVDNPVYAMNSYASILSVVSELSGQILDVVERDFCNERWWIDEHSV